MKLVELICLSLILALFSSAFTRLYSQLLKLDDRLLEVKRKSDSLIFISESFCNTCQGKGFSSFDKWKTGCGSLWQLEKIEWECLDEGDALFYGRWSGPYGDGEVYARKTEK